MGRPGTRRARHPDATLLHDLRSAIDGALSSVLARGQVVAFVNFPRITNVGDLLLWQGTMRTLDRLGVRVDWICEPSTYHPQAIERMDRCDAILINGGGNFGDMWRGQQATRERVLADFPGVPTIQLPQSLHYNDPRNLERMQTLLDRHGAFTAFWREGRSLTAAGRDLPGNHRPCPDMALALGALAAQPATREVVWLLRNDKEATTNAPMGVSPVDWLDPGVGPAPTPRERRALATAEQLAPRLSQEFDPRASARLARAYPRIAAHHVRRGSAILAAGRVVVTDRLHGHILALLLGRPHVLLDSATGKVRAVFEAWTRESHLAHWAENPTSAITACQNLSGS